MDASTDKQDRRQQAKGATVAARIAHWRAMSWEELSQLMREGGPATDARTVRVSGIRQQDS